ncbi:MAG: ABC transporter substrate-binding protein [Pseudomonadota bacterium]|nr:ABC transporter substrate-binding protein [Pseudomonadota bacterium]
MKTVKISGQFGRQLIGATAALAFSALGFVAPAQAEDPIKVGSFLAVTGPASFLGDPELKTLEMYIEQINADGGVLGRTLELVHYDVQHEAEKARTFTKRLIEDDKVDLIVGGSTTGTTMAVVPLVEKAGLPFISLAGAVVIIDPVKKWVFKTPHTDKMAAAKIFEDMQKNGIAKIALISGTGGFGKSGRAQSKAIAGEYGIEILSDETYGAKDTDMTAQLTKIKGAEGVQAVLNFGFGQGPAIVTKNYRQLGIELPLYQSHGVASKKYIELAGDAAEGVRLPAAALLVADQMADDDPQKAVVTGYKKMFEEKTGSDVSTFGGHAYDGLMMAVAAIERAGGTDKAKVRDEIEKTTDFVGTAGVVNMSAEDHLGLDLSSFRMLEIKDGNWTPVD